MKTFRYFKFDLSYFGLFDVSYLVHSLFLILMFSSFSPRSFRCLYISLISFLFVLSRPFLRVWPQLGQTGASRFVAKCVGWQQPKKRVGTWELRTQNDDDNDDEKLKKGWKERDKWKKWEWTNDEEKTWFFCFEKFPSRNFQTEILTFRMVQF